MKEQPKLPKKPFIFYYVVVLLALMLINALIVRVGMEKQEEVTATFNRLETIWSDYHVYQKMDGSDPSGKEHA